MGVSGAALKGASTFATGLADSTYQNQFSNAVTNQTNAYNRLAGLVNTGENAAAGNRMGAAATTGNTLASAAIAGGNASAAADNALGSSITNTGNQLAGYEIAKGLYGNTNNGPSTTPGTVGGTGGTGNPPALPT